MSNNYKIITRAKGMILNLKARGWSPNQIVKEVGVSYTLYQEILNYDPVSVKVHDVTIVKLREFLLKHENLDVPKPQRKKAGVKKESGKDEFATEVSESMKDAIPLERGIDPDHSGSANLLAELSILADKFAKHGYRLDASVTLTHTFK